MQLYRQHQQNYDIIKHMNEACVHTTYFDPQKYPVCNKFRGEDYSVLCKDLATSTINHDYQIVKKVFMLLAVYPLIGFPVSNAFNTKVKLIVDN